MKLSIKPGDGEYAPGSLTISANAAEVGDNTSDIDAAVEGPEGQIAFNVRYLNDVLGALKTPQVALEMQNSASAGVMRPVGNSDSHARDHADAPGVVLSDEHQVMNDE